MRLTNEITKKIDVPNDDDNGWVLIKHLKDNEIEEITSKVSETYMVNGETRVSIDTFERKRLLVKACLKDWGNMYKEDGSILVFNQMNLIRAAEFAIDIDDERLDFYSWIDLEREKLKEEVDKEKDDTLKN
jgi:hypothetical protein